MLYLLSSILGIESFKLYSCLLFLKTLLNVDGAKSNVLAESIDILFWGYLRKTGEFFESLDFSYIWVFFVVSGNRTISDRSKVVGYIVILNEDSKLNCV